MPEILIERDVTAVTYGDVFAMDDTVRSQAREGLSSRRFPAGWRGQVTDAEWADIEAKGAGRLLEEGE